jgi:hypothetical protein
MTIILSLYAFWLLYLAIMSLYRANMNKTITLQAKILGWPILILGALVDCIMNVTLFSLVFFELPKEFLLTKRMQRYIKQGDGWRCKLSRWICQSLLNAFDPTGAHC